MKKRQPNKPKAGEQLLLFPEIKQVWKQGLPDAVPIPAQGCIAFCHQCGQPNPGYVCSRCGARRCPTCGDA